MGRHNLIMTVNQNKNKNKNKKRKKIKNNNIIYMIEAFILTAAAVFLSVLSGTAFGSLTGFFCIIFASALFSCVLFLTSPSVILISGIASFAITLTLTNNIINAVSSLIYIIAGAFVYFGVRRKKSRTHITVGIAVCLSVLYMGMLVLYFLLETGTFSVGMLSSMIDSTLTNWVELAIKQYNSMLAQYSNSGINGGINIEEAAQAAYLMESYAKETVMNLKAVIPACFVLYNIIIAYLSTSVFRLAYNIFIPMANPNRKKINNKYWRINISAVSAVIMAAALVINFLVSKKQESLFTSIVMTNLIYILAPGFFLMGVYFAFDRIFKSRIGVIPVMLIISAVMLAFISTMILFIVVYALLAVLMITGIYAALIESMKQLFDKAKKVLFGDDDDNDDDDDYMD